MIPAQLDYVRPGSLDEALRILSDREGEAKLLSGGYSLIPLIKLRLAQPALLVDMQAITGLDGIRETDDHLVIGARATHRQIDESAGRRRRRYPGLADLAGRHRRPAGPQLGDDRRLRRRTPIPASDWPAVLLAGQRDHRVPRARRDSRDRGARLLPRHVHHGDRADRGPDRGPDLRRRTARVGRRPTRSSSARSATSRRRASRPSSALDAGGAIVGAGIGVTGVSASPYAATAAEAVARRQAAIGRGLPRGRRRGRRRRASRSRTSADPPSTSGRWSPSSPLRSLRRATERALSFNG